MGDFPKMTDSATFIINGAERAIVSQLVRSPGVYYGKELDKTDKVLLSTTVIPYRGAWLEYETDANDIFYVRIDKNRKIPITSFIRAIGVKTDAEIKELFGGFDLRGDIQPRGQLGGHHFACGALLQQLGKEFFLHDQVGQADPFDLNQQTPDQRGKRRDPVADDSGDARQCRSLYR